MTCWISAILRGCISAVIRPALAACLAFTLINAEAADEGVQRGQLEEAFATFLSAARDSSEFVINHPSYRDEANRPEGMAFLVHMMLRALEEVSIQDADFPFFRVIDFRVHEGGDNPDQRYLVSKIRGGEKYRIWGKRGDERRIEFQVYAGTPYDKGAGRAVSMLTMENVHFEADGSFEVILAPQRVAGNWLENAQDADLVLVRQIFSDWKNERPGHIHIDRIGYEGERKPALSAEAMAEKLRQAAAGLVKHVKVWPDFVLERYVKARPANTLSRPVDTFSQGGVKGRWISSAHFDLAEDEALIVTTWPASGNYQGIQLTDLWFSSLEYANRQTSLSGDQAVLGPDGAYTFVVAAKDPGVFNWLDTAGLRQGAILIRYDGMTEKEFSPDKFPKAQKIKLAELSNYLPAGIVRITPEERRNAIAERRRHVQLRFGN